MGECKNIHNVTGKNKTAKIQLNIQSLRAFRFLLSKNPKPQKSQASDQNL